MKLFLLMAMTWAQEHGAEGVAEHGHEVVIPWNSLFVQSYNFILLGILLFFLLRKSVKQHFTDRALSYKELVDRAENARKEAEQSHSKIKARLENLEAQAERGVSQARLEAADLRARMLLEAKGLGQKLEEEAKRSATAELEKAKSELRKELLEKAISASNESLKASLGTSDQKKLQNEFVEKIEVVGG